MSAYFPLLKPLLLTFVVVFGVGYVIDTAGARVCAIYGSGSNVPNEYHPPYEVFTDEEELLITPDCGTVNADIIFGKPRDARDGIEPEDIAIYKKGYFWHSDTQSWRPFDVNLAQVTEAHFVDMIDDNYWRGIAKTDRDLDYVSDPTYIVGYFCVKIDGQWKCGCRSTACTDRYWQLQAFYENGSPPIGGGSSTGVGSSSGVSSGTSSSGAPGPVTSDPPHSNHAVGQKYESQKLAYIDQARNKQAYRLTTWGKELGQDIEIGHTKGAQDNHQWSNNSSGITFSMKVGTQHFVFVMDVGSGIATLVAKDSNGRGSTFNRDSEHADEVIFWVKGSGYMDLVAVNTITLARRTIIRLDGATDAVAVSQSMDPNGRWIQSWVTGRGSCYAPVCSDRVQSVVIDTRPGGSPGPAQIHPAFPFDPDIQFQLTAESGYHDLYRDGAIWNPVYTSKTIIDQCYPLTAAGKCQLTKAGQRYALYDFSTNTSVLWREWPAHSAWSADGLYSIGDHGVIKLNPATGAGTCETVDGRCSTLQSGGKYVAREQTFGSMAPSERGRGMNQRAVVGPANSRLQEVTLQTIASVQFRGGSGTWENDPSYTLGYAFESGGDLRKQQYSPDGQWVMWRSNLTNTQYQTPPGPDDNRSNSRDIFIIDAR